jgi:hypothetical protein
VTSARTALRPRGHQPRGRRPRGGASPRAIVVGLFGTLLLSTGPTAADAQQDGGTARSEPGWLAADATTALARAERASGEVPHTGTLVVVSFAESGPRLAEVGVRRGDGTIQLVDATGRELGRTADQAFLRGSDRLLRVGGVERLPATLGLLDRKYRGELGAPTPLDTGPAVPVTLVERARDVVREVVYLDAETALVVRRETYDRAGEPVRLAAYTELDIERPDVAMPASDDLELIELEVVAAAADELRAAGFLLPETLPAGYELLDVWASTREGEVVTAHAVYGDGLYTLSVFQQPGRMAQAAVTGAARLRTADGGAVWRWPGSEPRRLVWTGEGTTFTALTDAPTDEVLEVLSGLPADPPPSILDRLRRGLERMGELVGGGRSTEAP